jgi:hypothetical protein
VRTLMLVDRSSCTLLAGAVGAVLPADDRAHGASAAGLVSIWRSEWPVWCSLST